MNTKTKPPKLDRRIIPNKKWPGMYHLRLGRLLTDMVNLTRAKDALAEFDEARRS